MNYKLIIEYIASEIFSSTTSELLAELMRLESIYESSH